MFVAGAGSAVGLVVGASISVLAWHGLRRLGPRADDGEESDESWGLAVLVTLVAAALMLPILWSPWFGVVDLIAVVLLRLLLRGES